MAATDSLIETFKEWVASSNPGLVTREDLARVEARLDELLELVEEIEKRLEAREAGESAPGSPPRDKGP